MGGEEELPDDWTTTANIVMDRDRKVLGVSSKQRKEDKETWWWDEEVQESIQKKRLAKKRWDIQRDEESKQEYKEMRRQAKKEVAKAKSNSSMYVRFTHPQFRKGCCGIYDFTAHIFLILSLTCTPKSGRGRRRFARCSVDMGDCWCRGRV